MASGKSQPARVILPVLGAVFVVWLLDFAGLLARFDGVVYDACLSRVPPSASPAVLLLDWQPEPKSTSYTKILRELKSLQARKIAFTFVPDDAPPDFDAEAAQLGVVFGRFVRPSNAGRDLALSIVARDRGLVCCPIASPLVAHGIVRRQRSSLGLGETSQPLFEAEVVRQLNPQLHLAADYGIRYRGGPGSLPRVSTESLFTGKVVPELVRDRIILIGRADSSESPGIWTPLTTTEPLSLLEFQGQAVDSLISGRTVRILDTWHTLPIVFALAVFNVVLVLRLGVHRLSWIGSVLFGAKCAGCAVSFLVFDLWIPVVTLVGAQLVCWLVICHDNAVRSGRAVWRLAVELEAAERQRPGLLTFSESKDPWELLLAFTSQSIETTRQLFLEVTPGSWCYRPVAAQNCSVADICEKRRDIGRVPFRDAVKSRSPVLLQSRPFFTTTHPDEVLYLVPMLFAGQLLGFWVLGVHATLAGDSLMTLLANYADGMAELLAKRRHFLANRPTSLVSRLFRFNTDVDSRESLTQAVRLLQKRLARAQRIVREAAGHPVFVSDWFGRVQEVNDSMRELLAVLGGSRASQWSMLEVITALTDQTTDRAQMLLSSVVHQRQRVTLPVSKGEKRYLLSIRPLTGVAGAERPTPFAGDGMVCELVDWTAQSRLDTLREQMMGQLAVVVRNDLAAVELATGLLATADCDAEERQHLGSLVSEKVRRVTTTFTEAQAGFDAPLAEGARFPVDSAIAFNEALAPRPSGVLPEVELTGPRVLPFVLAAPEPLSKTFAAVLDFLARDARPGSPIRVNVDQTDRWVRYTFATSGFGLPPDRLRQLLSPTEHVKTNEFLALRNGVRNIHGWGGVVEAESVIGQGMTVTLCLPMFA